MSAPITNITGTDCLLVVDANEADVKNLTSMLANAGFEILSAPNVDQAMKILARRRPDLILLDLHLPNMSGFEVCRRMQENPDYAGIPIIFLSANEDKNEVARALESGGMDFITKPFHKQELLSRVRTHLMLKTARDHANRLAQDKDEMVGMISHHLQSHLAGIQMSAQFLFDLAQSKDDPKLKLLTENIRASSGQLRAFLKTFLANAAADHGVHVKLQSISLTDSLVSTLQQYEMVAKAKDIVLHVNMPGDELLVHADATALNQVFDNLVSNAIKFSPPGRQIMITVRGGATFTEFRIQDQGVGFTDEDKAKMFRRYMRLSARPTGGEPSTGLGLSIVKKLVQAMHGDLTCESVAGKGALFVVRLATATAPLARIARPGDKNPAPAASSARKNRSQLQATPPAP